MSKIINTQSRWVRITNIENIPLREGRAVSVGGREIAIFNLGDRFLALESKCPHRGGPLADGIVSGGRVVCPLHAWKVDLETGEVANHEEVPCLKTFPAKVEAGILLIEISQNRNGITAISADCVSSVGASSSYGNPVTGEA